MATELDQRYPIGKISDQPFYERPVDDAEAKRIYLADIRSCPYVLEEAVLNLDESQLDTPYRDGGWTVKQVIHHVADSHMNALMRFKLGLTENNPTIKTYEEGEWAKLEDYVKVPINVSLTLLHSLHIRLLELIKDLSTEEWERTLFHPEHKKTMTLWQLLQTYSWHGKHHAAHITELRKKKGWE